MRINRVCAREQYADERQQAEVAALEIDDMGVVRSPVPPGLTVRIEQCDDWGTFRVSRMVPLGDVVPWGGRWHAMVSAGTREIGSAETLAGALEVFAEYHPQHWTPAQGLHTV